MQLQTITGIGWPITMAWHLLLNGNVTTDNTGICFRLCSNKILLNIQLWKYLYEFFFTQFSHNYFLCSIWKSKLLFLIYFPLQVYMLWKYNKFRKLATLGCASLVFILNGFLLDVREGWLCCFYIFASLLLLTGTFQRPFERKLPKFYV